MHELYELREMLCDALKEYGKKAELNAQSLDTVDKLAHAVKNLDKILGAYAEQDQSGDYPWHMGRYSSEAENSAERMVAELKEMMQAAPDEKTRQEFQRFISKIETM